MKEFILFTLAYIFVIILSPFVFVYNIIYKLYKYRSLTNIKEYIKTCAIGFDQAGGSVLYQKENFTISSYSYYLCKYSNKKCFFMNFINTIFGVNHCKNSYFWEKEYDKKELEKL